MRLTTLVVLAVLGAVLFSPVLTATVQAQGPKDVTFEGAKDSPGPVTFSHAKHKEAGADKCAACHPKIFPKMKKGGAGPLTMEKMKAGELCGSCHNGKTKIGDKVAFSVDDKANCDKCHKKK